ncbi:hypothetical protein [Aromatoleum diolicum]|uniref:Lipoprotein n=1 Tax=Aromatoleum diolicum TaxID=75796 RepID=A0ABX1QK24_9RHOO|nr:hypothetical protein [Aromatoleum diolicum]NMG77725.1 hypothetical protein [Aromatoleum diolicum]
MKYIKLCLLLVLAAAVTGCASMKMSTDDRKNLKRVNIASIQLPEKPMVLSSGAGIGFLLAGPLGIAIANGTSDLPTAYKDLLAQNKIDVAAGIQDKFKSQLTLKGIQVVQSATEADASLVVEVLQYGLTGSPFSSDRFPQLWANVKLTNRNGNVIWKEMIAAHISQDVMKQVEPRPVSDYFSDRALLETQINKVTEILVTSAVDTL